MRTIGPNVPWFPQVFCTLSFFLLSLFIPLSVWVYGAVRYQDQLIVQIAILSIGLFFLPFMKIEKYLNCRTFFPDGWMECLLFVGAFLTLISAVPCHSFFSFLRLLTTLSFYFLFRVSIRRDWQINFLLLVLFVTGVFYSVYGLLQYYGYFSHPYWYHQDQLSSRFVNAGHFACLLVFSFFCGIPFLFKKGYFFMRLIFLSGFLILLWALLLTRSRTLWLAFTIGLCLFFLLLLFDAKHTHLRGRILFFSLSVGIAGAILKGPFVLSLIYSRFYALVINRFESVLYRFEIWRGCLKAIMTRPWGWGLGAFKWIFPQFRTNNDRFIVDYAHNELLHTGVDWGILGLLMILLFFFQYCRILLRHVKSPQPQHAERSITLMSFLSLGTTLFLTVQFDFPIRIYAITLLFVLYLAMTAYLTSDGKNLQPQPVGGTFFLPKVILTGSLILAISLNGSFLYADLCAREAKVLDADFEWPRAIEKYREAIKFAPIQVEYYESLAALYRKKMALTFNKDDKKHFRELAVKTHQAALRLDPYRSGNYYFLAVLYEEVGELKKAKEEYQKALRVDPSQFFLTLEYGYFALRHKRLESALSSFEKLKNCEYRVGNKATPCDILAKVSEVTRDYVSLKRLTPEDEWNAHHCLASILAKDGQWDVATHEFNIALAMAENKSNVSRESYNIIRRETADIYVLNRRLSNAITLYSKALEKDPVDMDAQKQLDSLIQQAESVEKEFRSL